mgnify:CR=1 FL=1
MSSLYTLARSSNKRMRRRNVSSRSKHPTPTDAPALAAVDANDEFGVDVHELSPFLYYVFDCLFNVELTSNDVEGLFHL